MSSSTAAIERSTAALAGRSAARVARVEESIVINQPLAKVYASFSDRAPAGERLPSAADPAYRYGRKVMGRTVETRYTFYEVPGGTQVTAETESASHGLLDLAGPLAMHSARRQVTSMLYALQRRLE